MIPLFLLLACSDYEVSRRVLKDSYVQPGRSIDYSILCYTIVWNLCVLIVSSYVL